MRPLFPAVSPWKLVLVRCGFSFFSLCASVFARPSRKEPNSRPLVFHHLRALFHSLPKINTPSRFFSITSTTFCKSPGGVSPGSARRVPGRSAPRTGSGRCSLFAMSLFRHIVPSLLSAEKPYPTPYHLMAKRYRTHPGSVGVYFGSRVCFRRPGLQWSPGFRVCTCKP
jgi:hypothetical protein